MKFIIENVGPIKTATVELGKLTVVCGKNNTGKTWLTRSIYEFYKSFRSNLSFTVKTPQAQFPIDVDLSLYARKAAMAVKQYAKNYSSYILKQGSLKVSIKPSEFPVYCDAMISHWRFNGFTLRVQKEGSVLHIEEIEPPANSQETTNHKAYSKKDFQHIVSQITKHYLFSQNYNDCFLSDSFSVMSERNGLVHFKPYINIANAFIVNRSLNGDKNQEAKIQKIESEVFSNKKVLPLSLSLLHALSVFESESIFEGRQQLDFQKQFNKELNAMVSGQYKLKDGQFLFTPDDAKEVTLSMEQSSSSVESLLLLDYYVRFFSEKGDVLVIDEPELNLHPEKQRQLAHLLGSLVNAGIKVFITTHSDYIIREFNLMVQLNQDKQHIKAIREEEGYLDSYLLNADDIKAYVSEKEDGKVTFKSVKVCQKKGIVIPELDDVINKMNTIQDAILWGE